MKMLRRAVELVVVLGLAAAAVVAPASGATPAGTAAVADALVHPRPTEHVAKDRQGRVLLYVLGSQQQSLRQAVANVGGVVSAAQPGRVRAAVPADRIADLGRQPGVREVRRPTAVVPTNSAPANTTSEGVAASGANNWIAAGDTGSGAKVGIIDVGFANLAAAQQAGVLPSGPQVTVNNSNCLDSTTNNVHGTAVTEVVHDMAPSANLYLACISDDMGFAPATDWLQQQGVQVIVAAVSVAGTGRGDGTATDSDSPAAVVQRSSQTGVFWSVPAGNYAQAHYRGDARSDANGWVAFGSGAEDDGFAVANQATATVTLRWDAWPTTTSELDFYVTKTGAAPTGPDDPNIVASGTYPIAGTPGGGIPVQEAQFTNTTGAASTFWVWAKNINALQTTPFDLFVAGAAGPLSSTVSAGSITEPATSPYVTAVGATQPGSGQIEGYSSRGPTIDGRTKPDITGYDQVSTFTYGAEAFAGTSAAAAHVAGAAALLKSANPQLDRAEISALLTARATPVAGSRNDWGAGALTMGPPGSAPTPQASGYTSLPDPDRILGTAQNIGGHNAPFTPGEVFALPVPGVPSDTTAVAITVTGTSDSDTAVDVFGIDPRTITTSASNLRLQASRSASVTAIVPVSGTHGIWVRNSAGTTNIGIDLLGYFDPGGSGTYFPATIPTRVLDTRGPAQGTPDTPETGHIAAGTAYALPLAGHAGIPATATAVVVDLTALEAVDRTDVSVYSQNWPQTTETLAVAPNERRTNLTIVPLAPDGTIKLRPGQASVNLLIDVVGWFAPGQGGRYVPLAVASRIADTTTGTGLRNTPLGQGETASFGVAGLAGVSSAASSVVLTMAGSGDDEDTQLSTAPAEVGWTPVTSAGIGARDTSAALIMPGLGAGGQLDVRNEAGAAQVQLDVTGYFLGGQQATGHVGNCVTPAGGVGYTSLFDGRIETGLEAWQAAGSSKIAQNGCELDADASTAGVTWYGGHTFNNDYTLRLDWTAESSASSSGVYLGFPNPQGDPTVPGARGLAVAIGAANATGTQQTGSIAGLQAPTVTPAPNPPGQWNTFQITVSWNTITVLLNGQKINQYTTTDPNRINVPSFIGLANSGGVHFRDVEVRQNTAVRNGEFIGVNTLCLDLLDGNPANSTVQLHACNGTVAQIWNTTQDGRITAAGHCLDDRGGRSNDGNPIDLAPCNDASAQQWVVRSDGSIVNVLAGKCLTPSSDAPGATTQLGTCTGAANQVWQLPSTIGTASALTTTGGACLDVVGGNPLNNAIDVQYCGGVTANLGQLWTAPGDGTLRSDGECLDVKGASTAAGSTVELWTCNGNQAQQWQPQLDGSLINPVSGRCLTASSGSPGATLSIQDCTGASYQQWAHIVQYKWRGEINGPAGKCAAVQNGDPSTHVAALYTCDARIGIDWAQFGDGTVRAYAGQCLDVTGAQTADSTVVESWACTANDAAQDWVPRPNGSLVNPVSDRVLDDRNAGTADGTVIQIYDSIDQVSGHDNTAQRWALPAPIG